MIHHFLTDISVLRRVRLLRDFAPALEQPYPVDTFKNCQAVKKLLCNLRVSDFL